MTNTITQTLDLVQNKKIKDFSIDDFCTFGWFDWFSDNQLGKHTRKIIKVLKALEKQGITDLEVRASEGVPLSDNKNFARLHLNKFWDKDTYFIVYICDEREKRKYGVCFYGANNKNQTLKTNNIHNVVSIIKRLS